MSASFIVPFNHDPASSFVTQSNYTVPSGKYAYIEYIVATGRLYLDSVILDSGAKNITEGSFNSIPYSANSVEQVLKFSANIAAAGSIATVSTNFKRVTTSLWHTITSDQEGYVSVGAYLPSSSTMYVRVIRDGVRIAAGSDSTGASNASTGDLVTYIAKAGDLIERYNQDAGNHISLVPAARTGNGSMWLKSGQVITCENWTFPDLNETVGKDFILKVTEYNSIS